MLANFGERAHFCLEREESNSEEAGEGQKGILRVGVKLKIEGESLSLPFPTNYSFANIAVSLVT